MILIELIKNIFDVFMLLFPLWIICFIVVYGLSFKFKNLQKFNYLYAGLLVIIQFALIIYVINGVAMNYHQDNSFRDITLIEPYVIGAMFNILITLFVASKNSFKYYIIPFLTQLILHFWYILYY